MISVQSLEQPGTNQNYSDSREYTFLYFCPFPIRNEQSSITSWGWLVKSPSNTGFGKLHQADVNNKSLYSSRAKSNRYIPLLKLIEKWKQCLVVCVWVHHARDKSGFFWRPRIHEIKFGPDNSGLQQRERTLFLSLAFQRPGRIRNLGLRMR